MKKLTLPEVRHACRQVPEWKRRGQRIERVFEFTDFKAALKFVNALGRAAEKAWHHPDFDIRWNRVRVVFTTHDAGGLTKKDFDLARRADVLAG